MNFFFITKTKEITSCSNVHKLWNTLYVVQLTYGDKLAVRAALSEATVFERSYTISPQNYPGDGLSRPELFSSVQDSRCLHIFPPNDKDTYTDHADGCFAGFCLDLLISFMQMLGYYLSLGLHLFFAPTFQFVVQ